MTKILSILFSFFLSQILFCQTYNRSLSSEKWTFSQAGKNQHYPATVPGCVHLDLMKNKVIERSLFGRK